MTYEEFKENLINAVREKLEYDADVQTAVFAKNNGNEREAFTIKTDCPAAPILYFDELYAGYSAGISIENLAQSIMERITDYNDEAMGMVNELLSGTWDDLKDRVEASVVNWEWNKTKLNKVPHIKYLDLAIVFRVCLDEKDGQKASTVITYGLLNQWGVSESDLVYTAFSNLQKEQFTIQNMADYLEEHLDMEELEGECSMYLFTNKSKVHGAVGLMRTDLIGEFAKEQKHDIFVIPSSIHETLLVPFSSKLSKSAMKQMIKEVNHTQLNKEEWLSENLYYYSRKRQCLELVA